MNAPRCRVGRISEAVSSLETSQRLNLEAEPRLAFVPFDPNPHFVSRSFEIEKLKKRFSTNPRQRTAALYGLGGVGYVSLFAKYCQLMECQKITNCI